MRLHLTEAGGARTVAMTADQARRLAKTGVVEVRPGATSDAWEVRPGVKVGAVSLDGMEIRIAPKVPVARLLFLLGYARSPGEWRDDTVGLPEHPDLVPALAVSLWRQVDRALRGGLLQGYRERDETSPVLRGRLRETDQLGRWHGLPYPLEIRHDEYTADIAENRILATAVERMLRLPGVDADTHRGLRHQASRFVGVTLLRPGQRPPSWRPTRLNTRYQAALRLADLVLLGSSVEAGVGRIAVNGFLLDMAAVFEDFLSAALRRSIQTRYGGAVAWQSRGHLDVGGELELRPDILWRLAGRTTAVVDAKYKAYTPVTDAYQMLAYCTAYGLTRGHLVYVTGEHPPVRHVVRNAGVEIVCHAVDLGLAPKLLLQQVDRMADEIASSVPVSHL